MILTGKQIHLEMGLGTIVISPFIEKNLGPNSYDVTLNSRLLIYQLDSSGILDMQKPNSTTELHIPEEGFVLQPGVLYLGCTNETAVSNRFVPLFEGRSSIGRLGINTHITAGFGDIGWGYEQDSSGKWVCQYPTWTLEMTVVHPIRVYPNCRIGQVYFLVPSGELSFYKGKYSRQKTPQASKSYQDFGMPPSESTKSIPDIHPLVGFSGIENIVDHNN